MVIIFYVVGKNIFLLLLLVLFIFFFCRTFMAFSMFSVLKENYSIQWSYGNGPTETLEGRDNLGNCLTAHRTCKLIRRAVNGQPKT